MAEYDKVIPAGQSGKIIASLSTKRYSGKLNKTITVVSNDPNNSKITLTLKSSVLGVTILPVARAYFYTRVGKSKSEELTIATIGEGPITVNAIASHPQIVLKVEHLSQNLKPPNKAEYWEQYKLHITIPDNFPEGRFAEQVTLVTDSEYHPKIKISVAGEVTPSVVTSPSSVRMLSNGGADYPNRLVKVTQKDGENFKITRIITDPDCLKAEITETKKGQQYQITLSWQDISKKGEFKGKVIIHTNDSYKSVLNIPVTTVIK